MIRCTLEIIPHGNEKEARKIGIIEIINNGLGTEEFGNYDVVIRTEPPYRKIPIRLLKQVLLNKKNVQGLVTGKIKKYNRYNIIYNLLAKSLRSCGFK